MPYTTELNSAIVRRIVRTPRPLLTPLMLAALGIAGVARAQDGGGAVTNKDLLDRIERLEASNRALAGEVQTLRSADEKGWLSEERAAEIRSIVTDVLADSELRNSLQGTGSTAGWSDGFFLQSADGRFRMEVGGQIQFRYIYSWIPNGSSGVTPTAGSGLETVGDNTESRSGFDMPNTQLELKGHVFGESYQYYLKGAFANTDEAMIGDTPLNNLGNGSGSFRMLDAYMRVELDDQFSLKIGQFKLPYAREQLIDSGHQMAVSRSTVVEHLGVWRSQGLELDWTSDNARVMVAYSDGGTDNVYGVLQSVGSDPMNSAYWTDGVDWAVTGRVEWKMAGRWEQFNSMTSPPGDELGMLVGVAFHAQSGDPELTQGVNNNQPNEWYAMTADVSMMYGGATFFGSVFVNSIQSGSAFVAGQNNFDDPALFDIGGSNVWGMVVQGSYYMTPKWEVFGRYEYGNATINGIDEITNPNGTTTLDNGNALSILTIGANWYLDGEDLKWTTDFGVAIDSLDGVWWNGPNGWRASEDGGELVFRSQLQLRF